MLMTPQKTNALLLVCALQYISSCLYLQGPVFVADFSGPVVSVLDGTPSKFCTTTTPHVSA